MSEPVAKVAAATPMMAQYLEIKSRYPDALLFYRMGDFYEMFFEDAVAAAAALDITLTKRGTHQGNEVPMCGVPVHASESYLLALIRKGFRVAVCEQLEDPAAAKKRGSKAVVKRDVVRLVTPGTLTEDSLLDARRHNDLAAFSLIRSDGALAWVDISTGALHVTACPPERLEAELARLGPRELLVAEDQTHLAQEFSQDLDIPLTPLARSSFDSNSGTERLKSQFGVATLDGFGPLERADISALGALLDYLRITQKDDTVMIQPPRKDAPNSFMQIDAATRRNLELTQSLSGTREGSLLAVIDRTVTAPGARLLLRQLNSPSLDLNHLMMRQNAIDSLLNASDQTSELRDALRLVPDLERALSRLALGRGGPRDLSAIRDTLKQALNIAVLMCSTPDTLIGQCLGDLGGHEELLERLQACLIDEPPLMARDGGFIREGIDADLDDARSLSTDGKKVIAGMQGGFSAETGITALKIKHNNVLGYFIETPATHAEKMLSEPFSGKFIHRQTTANAIRFTTTELSSLETRLINASARQIQRELAIFETLRELVIASADTLHRTASAIAQLDLLAALADLARDLRWCRPVLTADKTFEIRAGRHPVVEAALQGSGATGFVPNDCNLSAEQDDPAIWLLTGPNMAGKSTFLRQNALIALLAQIGSYVPAENARIGLVSQLFSRVGASDDLARGRSTFMVEMVETAAILNQADAHALVILDEIGRGTATYDGLSIAWAVLEHLLAQNRCRALFATHYHELTTLAKEMDGLTNATMCVREWENEVIFLHEVKQGAADRSYGVQVAKLAGLPESVIERSRLILSKLEAGDRNTVSPEDLFNDLPLFSAVAAHAPEPEPPEIEARLRDIEPDSLSPRDALQLLYELKSLLRG